MDNSILKAAYGGLLHDIGKPLQRSFMKSDLKESEKDVTPINRQGGFHTHLHAGYTSRFLKEQLHLNNEFEYFVSSHHLNLSDPFAQMIKQADQIASAIDRNDVSETEDEESKKSFHEVRLNSIFSQVTFSNRVNNKPAYFPIRNIEEAGYPIPFILSELPDKAESVAEYTALIRRLYDSMQHQNIRGLMDPYAYDRMNALMYEYMTTIPASTFESSKTYVSLYDHSKLTSAIAACLAASNGKKKFHMLEFDISGIQNFIFKITEGRETKQSVAKALRGRSFLVSVISDYIASSYLYEFDLPQANIIFNAGGGATILLPDIAEYEEKVKRVSDRLQRNLFELFHTQITFVYADVLCDEKELEVFKQQKAVDLKARLDEAKNRKFSAVLSESFYYEPPANGQLCKLCGESFAEEEQCTICKKVIEISNLLTKNKNLILMFCFHDSKLTDDNEAVTLKIGEDTIVLTPQSSYSMWKNQYEYIESINHTFMGMTRYITSEVPLRNYQEVLDFESICELAPVDVWGDAKLGILKMDVDNLGAIFAYGMGPQVRSLSKSLALSRNLEYFFGHLLPEICREVSAKVNPNIFEKTSNGTMFYINYAGGDDLVILGPAAGILQLANEIYQKFSAFTLNPDITISGGIWIQNPSHPIRFGILNAEEQLEKSKSNLDTDTGNVVKNALTVLDTTIPFKQFSNVLDQVNFWKNAINNNSYSRTAFYSLMLLLGPVKGSKKIQFNDYARHVPIALYELTRNINNRKSVEDLAFSSQMRTAIQSITSEREIS